MAYLVSHYFMTILAINHFSVNTGSAIVRLLIGEAGEAVLRLDDPSKLKQLKEKAAFVETELGEKVLPVLVTHFAVGRLLERAERAGVMVVQSFEW